MGWPALAFEEAAGGLSGAAPEICALVSELGRGLLVGSYIVGTVLPGRAVAAAPPSALRAALLEGLISGTRSLSFADIEPASRGASSNVATRATAAAGSWILDGTKTNVWSVEQTRTLLVSAVTSGARPEELLLTVPLDAPGLTRREFPTIDGGRALECTFSSVPVPQAKSPILSREIAALSLQPPLGFSTGSARPANSAAKAVVGVRIKPAIS